jgi:hypothetical protein
MALFAIFSGRRQRAFEIPPRRLNAAERQLDRRRYRVVMRIAFALVCLTVIAAVAGVGVGAIGSARDMSFKQRQELDTAIDQIVAEHKEQKVKERRESASTTGTAQAKLEIPSGFVALAGSRTGNERKIAKGPETAERAEPEAADRPEPKPARSKSQRPRGSRVSARNNALIPHAFLSLPKFAASTLFGFR